MAETEEQEEHILSSILWKPGRHTNAKNSGPFPEQEFEMIKD
jgi:hypothetical protein